jgi:hypothetical protein
MDKNSCRITIRKTAAKVIRKPIRRQDNIKMTLREIGCNEDGW